MTRSGRPPSPALIVMTRFPRAGCVKTRMQPALGPEGAAALHSSLARHCIRRMHAAGLSRSIRTEVHATGASSRDVRRWIGRAVRVLEQVAGDLGERLSASAHGALASGAPSVLLVGSDAPDLGGTHVRAALDALARGSDVVLGPAADGGYYLVAIHGRTEENAITALFGTHIPWGTDRVLEVTLAAAHDAGLGVHILETLPDIDRPEDLSLWEEVLAEEERVREAPRLSVIIPTLDEEATITSTIESALAAGAHEVVVADGGSADRTVALAAESGARVVTAKRGRALQLSSGVAAASGDVLLFLHADTTLPPGALDHVRRTMSDPDVVLGAFRFSAGDPSSLVDRLISTVGDWRHRVFQLPYGDQAPFVRAQDFTDLGGFADIPVLEDYEFAQRCTRLGRCAIAPAAVRTSTRAWHDHGLLRTTATNAAVIAGYRLGVPVETLAGWRRTLTSRGPAQSTTAPASEPDRSDPSDPR